MNLEISHAELLDHLKKRAAFYRRELKGMVAAGVVMPDRKKARWFAELATRLKPPAGSVLNHVVTLTEFEALELGALDE